MGRRDIGSIDRSTIPTTSSSWSSSPQRSAPGSFLADPALKEEMEQAGVQGEPTVILCEEVDVVSY
jgi:hypothetical protein